LPGGFGDLERWRSGDERFLLEFRTGLDFETDLSLNVGISQASLFLAFDLSGDPDICERTLSSAGTKGCLRGELLSLTFTPDLSGECFCTDLDLVLIRGTGYLF